MIPHHGVRHRFGRLFRRLALAAVATFVLAGAQCVATGPRPGGGPVATPAPQAPQIRTLHAEFTRGATCRARVGTKGGRGFGDRSGLCYACPRGFGRTIFPVTAGNACEQGGPPPFGRWAGSENLGRPGCGPGEFQVGERCYVCPPGSRRGRGATCTTG